MRFCSPFCPAPGAFTAITSASPSPPCSLPFYSGIYRKQPGIFPKRLADYAIFGDTIYSPCDGIVVRAVDGLPDLQPHEVDTKQPAGNHVVIECKSVNILIAHMMNGSVLVKERDILKAGGEIGRVGNSGNTFEPHLHIHAVKSGHASLRGKSIPILFHGRFLSLNSLVESSTK